MAAEPGDTEDDGVVAEGGNEHRQVLKVVVNLEGNFADVGDVARGDGTAINNFQSTGFSEREKRQVVLTREVLVHKRESSRTTVN